MNYAHEFEEYRRPAKPSKPVVLPTEDDSLWGMMENYLEGRKLSLDVAESNGWYPARDREGTPRIVMPASSLDNTWPYYQARAMDNHPKRYDSPPAPRGDALIVVQPRYRSLTRYAVAIVEGPMDALAAAEWGAVGIALMGCTPSLHALRYLTHLLRAIKGKAVLIPDKDAIAEGAAVVGHIWKEGLQCTLKPAGAKDLAAMTQKQREQFLTIKPLPS